MPPLANNRHQPPHQLCLQSISKPPKPRRTRGILAPVVDDAVGPALAVDPP